jgi:hypothetical protein
MALLLKIAVRAAPAQRSSVVLPLFFSFSSNNLLNALSKSAHILE